MANVVIEQFGAFYNKGEGRGVASDKIWGIAVIGNTRVVFWGRRNSKLRFKTMVGLAGQEAAMETWWAKTNPLRKGDVYTSIPAKGLREMLAPTLEKDLVSHFYSDMAKGKLNTSH